MRWYELNKTLTAVEHEPGADTAAVVLMTSDELSHCAPVAGLERTLHHTPQARDAKVCKAEVRSDCMAGTLVVPQSWKNGEALRCGYLVTARRAVLVDDTGVIESHLKHIMREKHAVNGGVGLFLYYFFENLIAKDLHHLEEIEDRAQGLEDDVLSGRLDNFNTPMTRLRKETMAYFRYYSQLDDVACELHENENGFFTESEQRHFRLFEERVIRLREEAQLLREYCTQLQTMFQAEIDIRQNRIMKILTIVTTIFLPLSLLVGWYGMNFVGMPELTWKYGYPVVIAASVVVVIVSLLVCKKKKFW